MNNQKKKRNNGVSHFSEVKCLTENNDFFFKTFVCAFFENTHSYNEAFTLSILTLPKLINTIVTWVDLISLSLPILVGWFLILSRQKRNSKKKRK